MLFTTFISPKSIYFYSISQSSLWLTNKEKTFLSGDVYVLHVMLWNFSFLGWRFPVFYGLYLNTSLIFQFQENVSSFDLLANALTWQRLRYISDKLQMVLFSPDLVYVKPRRGITMCRSVRVKMLSIQQLTVW